MSTKKTAATTDDIHAINTVLDDFLARRAEQANRMSPHYESLWSDIDRLVHSGGKRLRPRLALFAYRMFGGKEKEAIVPVAAALELLHLGMLIHDDIIDRDYIRYGVDNIAGSYYKKYDELVPGSADRIHYSHSAALLAGDLLLSESYILMTESAASPHQVLAVQRLLGQSIFEVIGGELLDTEAAFRAMGEISTEKIARYKTASYTTTLPLLVGAQLAGLSEEEQVHIRTFGRNLGIAFQLRDDMIGVFGSEAITGKSAIGDIREGKRTYMVEQFYQLATQQQRSLFEQHFGKNDITAHGANVVRDLLNESGAAEATELAIKTFELKARAGLEKLAISAEYLEELNDFIAALTERVK